MREGWVGLGNDKAGWVGRLCANGVVWEKGLEV